jgi:two-component system copper resistance phosphate regulon response regulator CusR
MRLLLVEDDAKLADMVARSLREQGYAVDIAADGLRAEQQARINEYDGIVLDLGLPGLDGLQVSQSLRKAGKRVPILMLTARDSVRDRVAGLDAGADDYLTKPFALEELHARLRALLRRMPELLPPTLQVSDLVVDTRSQTVKRGSRGITLTGKEYSLLEYLARNAGRVVGRAELSEHVWDENHDPFSNALEVYINRVRRKIDDDGPSLIHTHRGAGYRLDSAVSGGTGDPSLRSG